MDTDISPLAGWQIGAVGSERVIVFRPHTVDRRAGRDDVARPGPYYLMTPSQCLSLICELTAAGHDLENAARAPAPRLKVQRDRVSAEAASA
jgi:hypothetical protein